MDDFKEGFSLTEPTLSELIKRLQDLENTGYGDHKVTVCGEGPVCVYVFSDIISIDNDEDLLDEDDD